MRNILTALFILAAIGANGQTLLGERQIDNRKLFFPVNQTDTVWRYFYITYLAKDEREQMQWGDFYWQRVEHPKLEDLRNYVKDIYPGLSGIQINITEMKPEDFKRFTPKKYIDK